jgi:diguanylate cyclase (GGDEF)-like protein
VKQIRPFGFNTDKVNIKWVKAGLVLPLAVLVLAVYVTLELWQEAQLSRQQSLQSRYDFLERESLTLIRQRMTAYEQVLRGVQGMFAASGNLTRAEFRAYVQALRLNDSYPGIQGIGFSIAVPAGYKTRHVAAVRAEGFPAYDIIPDGDRDFYSSIVYIEPFDERNLRAFGYDMYIEPIRRAAMVRARDTGNAAISGMVTLVQETGQDVQPGFLMYLPVYKGGMPHETLAERRANLKGWVYAPFRMDDLMRNLNGEHAGDLDIEVFDGTQVAENNRMYDVAHNVDAVFAPGRLKSVTTIEVGGHYWTVASAALSTFTSHYDDRSMLILRGGISISLLLGLTTWLLLDDRTRAFRTAKQAMHLALYDVLTGLPNRKLITERLSQALNTARRENIQAALLFIDLDRFKPVNDDFGHAIGDLLLKDVAKRLQDCMRAMDTAARLGGDEFVALLPHVEGKRGALVVANKILGALEKPFDIAGHTFHISASIGVAFYPDHGSDEKQLMKNADAAMYRAKKSGRNGVVFYEA